MDFKIVPAAPDPHAAAIREIFNEAIANTTALYDYQPRSMETVLQWFGAKARDGYPVVAAVEDECVLGFASFGPFRAWPAYQYTIEHSLYVHCRQRRRGVGQALLVELVKLATERSYRTMVGGIDADNRASIALHEAQGFAHAGTIREAGYKFGRWLDLAFYQKSLPGPARPRE